MTLRCYDHIGRADYKGSQRNSGGDGDDLYLGSDVSYMEVYICQFIKLCTEWGISYCM